MTCIECLKTISVVEHLLSHEKFGISLCNRHFNRVYKVTKPNRTSKEAVQLYYRLKKCNLNPTLEWWDGKRSIDISISRVKLNIDIDTKYDKITEAKAISDLEETMHSFKNGFTSIKIPSILITEYLEQTARNIEGIVEGLHMNMKKI